MSLTLFIKWALQSQKVNTLKSWPARRKTLGQVSTCGGPTCHNIGNRNYMIRTRPLHSATACRLCGAAYSRLAEDEHPIVHGNAWFRYSITRCKWSCQFGHDPAVMWQVHIGVGYTCLGRNVDLYPAICPPYQTHNSHSEKLWYWWIAKQIRSLWSHYYIGTTLGGFFMCSYCDLARMYGRVYK